MPNIRVKEKEGKRNSGRSAKYSKIVAWVIFAITTIIPLVSVLIFYLSGALNGVGWSNTGYSPVIMGFISAIVAGGYVLGMQLLKNNHTAKIVTMILMGIQLIVTFLFFVSVGINISLAFIILCIIPVIIMYLAWRSIQLE